MYKKVQKNPNVKDFSYWNNTDEDDGVSKRAWKQREIVWDEIFSPSPAAIPNETGLVYEFSSQHALRNICREVIHKYSQDNKRNA